MQGRTPILIAVIAAVAAVLLVNQYATRVRMEAQPNLTQVVVAARELQPGTILSQGDLSMALRAAGSLPRLALKWNERSLYLGQQIKFPVLDNDYVLASYFGSEAEAAQRLSDRIDATSRKRAVTIPVTSVTSLESSIRPGDRIDLLVSFRMALPGSSAERGGEPLLSTVPLLENVYVLTTGTFGQGEGQGYGSITVHVEPDEAKLLVWATKLGELSILLRNSNDLSTTDRAFLRGTSADLSALGGRKATIEEIRGAEASEALGTSEPTDG